MRLFIRGTDTYEGEPLYRASPSAAYISGSGQLGRICTTAST